MQELYLLIYYSSRVPSFMRCLRGITWGCCHAFSVRGEAFRAIFYLEMTPRPSCDVHPPRVLFERP